MGLPVDIRSTKKYLASFSGPIVGCLLLVAVAAMSLSRAYFGFGTETDFLGGFMIDAAHLLRGEALEVAYHPPFYSIVLAGFQWLLDDWFVSGRLLSFVASALVIAASYSFYRDALSKPAALGAVLALAVSPIFLTYSTFAVSDVFFVALYSLTLLAAFRAGNGDSVYRWAGAGVVLGLALLSRTNAISLLLVVLIPLVDANKAVLQRLRDTGAVVVGMFIPFAIWAGYAAWTNSPFMPSGTYVNLALTFFAPEGAQVWAEGVSYAEKTFDGTLDVLLHDPVRLFGTYANWLYGLPGRVTSTSGLFAYPMSLVVWPAFLYLLFSVREKWVVYALVITLGQIAVVNFKTFEARYYLFLIPLLGAAIGHSGGRLFFNRASEAGSEIGRIVVRLVIVAIVCLSVASSIKEGHELATRNDAELGEVLGVAGGVVQPGSAVVARKSNVAFYTNSTALGMPRGTDIEDLHAYLREQDQGVDVYVYYGSIEKQLRSEYGKLLDPGANVPWLRLEATGSASGDWALYRYMPLQTQAD
jgi:4-amino-4-deoxy-L-arabinose transferase-like glycosyltransferase